MPPGERRPRKRARIDPEENGVLLQPPPLPSPPLQSEFKPGAVRYVHLENFQSSSSVQYTFGPSLNMIIGANGTGKSTVVMAIFLMFGGNRKDLSRNSHAEFIQKGKTSAYVEVCIESLDPNTENPVLGMRLSTEKRDPTYTINGRETGPREFAEFVAKFQIQVNNLCQFLPQQRVSAFSAETPQARLKSTLGALRHPQLLANLEILCDLSKRFRETTESRPCHAPRILELKEITKDLAEKLQQMHVVDQRQNDLKRLKWMGPIVELGDLKKSLEPLQNELDNLHSARSTIESDVAEKRSQLALLCPQITECARMIAGANDELSAAQVIAAGAVTEFNSARRKLTSKSDEYEQVLSDQANQAEERDTQKRLTAELSAKASAEASKVPSEEALAAASHKVETLVAEYKDFQRLRENELGEINDHSAQLKRQLTVDSNLVATKTAQLQRMSTENAMRLRGLEPSDQSTIQRAMAEVADLKTQLKMNVHPPAVLCCSIKSQSVLKQVATAARSDLFLRFVCECHHDWTLLTQVFHEKGISAQPVELSRRPEKNVADHERPFSSSELQNFGLSGYIIDLFEGPEIVLNMLCIMGQLHAIPYAETPLSSMSRQRLQDIDFTGRIADSQSITTFQRSKYGQKQKFVNILQLESVPKHIRVMLSGHDPAQDDRLRQQIKDLEERTTTNKTSLGQLEQRGKDISDQLSQLRATVMSAKEDWKNLMRPKQRYERLSQELSSAQARLVQLQDTSSWDARISSILDNVTSLTTKLTQSQMATELGKLDKIWLKLMQLNARLATLEMKKVGLERYINTQMESIEKEISVAIANIDAHTVLIDECKRRVVRLKHENLEEYKTCLALAKDLTSDTLEEKIERLQAEVALLDHLGNFEETRVLSEEAQLELRTLEGLEEQRTSELSQITSRINEILNTWAPEVNSVIDDISKRFGDLFKKLHCGGNVTLVKSGLDVDKWGLEIRVAYRRGEQPRALTNMRQSGGEKAVATAVYLIALQTLSSAPFRVVDEINQGMDKANEMSVQRFIVDAACQSNAQYFLINPKLLLDSPYHPKMEVVCINSGSYIEP